MSTSTQSPNLPVPVLLTGAILAAATFYWAFTTSALPGADFATLLEITGARYVSAFLAGVAGAHIAAMLMSDGDTTRQQVVRWETTLLLAVATVLATLAIYLHFGVGWSLAGFALMALVGLLHRQSNLPYFMSNGIAGFSFGVVVGAMVYLYMSSANPVSLTQTLTGNFAQLSLWQPIVLATCLVAFIVGHWQLADGLGLGTRQLAILLLLVTAALVGIVPFIVSVALLTQRLIERIQPGWRLLNYLLVGSLCLYIEALSTSLLAGNSLPFGLTLVAVFLPIVMGSLATAESGWRFALNILAIAIVAIALWLVLLLNYLNFIGQIV